MKLIIVRHGETIENLNEISQGHIDGTLSPNGREQIKKLAQRLKNEKIDYIYSSDLGRVKDTLKEILEFHPNVPVTFDQLLRERSKGIFEGKPQIEHRRARLASGIGRFQFRPEGGESFEDVRCRVQLFMEKISAKHKPEDTVLISTHGGWKNAFMSYLMDIPYKDELLCFDFKNTSVSIFDFNADKKHKVFVINCTKHLEDEGVK